MRVDARMPQADGGGFVPTLNQMGFMTTSLDVFSRRFVKTASNAAAPVLEVGAAYGVATLPALAAGAQVMANDADPRHLEILRARVPERDRQRLTLVPGEVPNISVEDGSLSAILAARVLHFLPEKQLLATAAAMARWLAPGGLLFIVEDTPWLNNSRSFIPVYEERRRRGERWPGMIDDVRPYRSLYSEQCPAFFHFFDVASLTQLFEEAGLSVVICETFARPDYPTDIQMDGREGIGLIAERL